MRRYKNSLKNLVKDYRKAINPPYSKNDYLVLGTTFLVLLAAFLAVIILPNRFNNQRKEQAGALTGGITLNPGDDIQAVVNANPEGTTFNLNPGIYRLQTILPKNSDSFIGAPGAVLNGSRLLTSFTQSGSYWLTTGQTQQGDLHGSCSVTTDTTCHYPDDVFRDNIPLKRVLTLAEVGTGKYYFDYTADTIYLGDDPAGHVIEAAVNEQAFYGDGTVSNVTIKGLVIEKYATYAQFGAIQGEGSTLTKGWIVSDNEIRLNHGGGIRTGDGMQILRNNIHNNGQIGIVGKGDKILVDGNTISTNNTMGFSSGWEAGGTKFVATTNLTVRNNTVDHNHGPGLWTDGDNIYTLYDGNLVYANDSMGIFHEISYDATIRNNQVYENGFIDSKWFYGSQILLSNSQNVEVVGNQVRVLPEVGDGIGIINQNRGTGLYGPWLSKNDYVHNNDVLYERLDATADKYALPMSGLGADYDQNNFFYVYNNRFDYNTYHTLHPDWYYWATQDWVVSFAGFQQRGQETHGTVDTNTTITTPTPTSVVNTPTSAPMSIPTNTPILTPTPFPTVLQSDTTSPSVAIANPLNGSTVTRNTKVTLSATVSDNVRVTQVQFSINGTLTCSDTSSPYTCIWKVPGAKNRTYTITAKAFDAAGNNSTSSVKVTAK